MMKRIFLLGGYDLEMLTIRELLESYSEICFDRHLSWDTALLAYYQEELSKYGNNDDYIIYGIELRSSESEDIISNYKLIDHHNEYSDQLSALAQVAEIIGHPLTHCEQLIAANDSAYIPGMQSMGATAEEIEQIRYKDRRAQGVTGEDERLAKKAIEGKKELGDISVVYSETSRFSPITDRLYPYKNLLIYTGDEWMFYGDKAKEVYEFISRQTETGCLFHGGGFGFTGVPKGIFPRQEIDRMVELIIKKF
jgi:hypothetical protein